ncbi:aminoglycoside phosphotransferase family protein [Candidatus Woesearchaeota archaeon]|nr:aminoglycoside phosphotransferase family protein [Candidatus Woesearchaeota archaeon]
MKEKIKAIFKKQGLRVLSVTPLSKGIDKGGGVLNPLYFVKCSNKKEYVFRITKAWWKNKTVNELFVIKLLRETTKIPVPNILFYDVSNPKFEYLCWQKIPGEALQKVFPILKKEQKRRCIDQMIFFLSELQKLRFDKIGSFDLKGNIVQFVDLRKGPYTDYKTYLEAEYKEFLKRIKELRFKKYIPFFKKFLEKELPKLPMSKDFQLTHGDFDMSNMLYHKGKINALLDFEWSSSCIPDSDYNHLYRNVKNKNYVKKSLAKQGIQEPYGFSQRFPLYEMKRLAMSFGAYHTWFSDKKKAKDFIRKKIAELELLKAKYDINK